MEVILGQEAVVCGAAASAPLPCRQTFTEATGRALRPRDRGRSRQASRGIECRPAAGTTVAPDLDAGTQYGAVRENLRLLREDDSAWSKVRMSHGGRGRDRARCSAASAAHERLGCG